MALHQILHIEVVEMRASSTLILSCQPLQDLLLYGDTSTGTFRPLVPVSPRQAVFELLHNSSHPVMRATRRLIYSRFVWPKLTNQGSTWVRECMPISVP